MSDEPPFWDDLKGLLNGSTASWEAYNNQGLMEYLPLPANIVDDAGRYMLANKIFCDLVGYSKQELISLSFWDIVQERSYIDVESGFKSVRTFGIMGWLPCYYTHKGGMTVQTRIKGKKITLSGKNYYFALIENS